MELLRHNYKTTTLLTVGCLALLVCMMLSRFNLGVPGAMSIGLSVLLSVFLRRRNFLAVLAAVVMGGSLGVWRGGVMWEQFILYEDYFGEKVVLKVRAAEDAVYDDNSQLAFSSEYVRVDNEDGEIFLPGRVQISGFGTQAVYRGDEVIAEGKLRPSRGSNIARMTFADLEVTGRPEDWLQQWRQRFAAGMQTALPEPAASFGMGILIGQRSTLPEEVEDNLSAAGLTHLVAVSGANLTVLVRASKRLFAKQSHFQSTALAGFLVVAFLLCTGFSASIVRAAIIAALSLTAGYYGRSIQPVLLICLGAVITAMMNPLYIWFDIAWYLSFTSFFGVIILGSLVTKRIWKGKEPKMLVGICLESVCAQLLTLPIITWIFGRLSIYSLFTNVLAVPFVPIGMLLSVFAGAAGMVSPLLGGLVGLPARYILVYILDVAAFFARLPHSLIERHITVLELIAGYAAIMLVCWLLHCATRSTKMEPVVQ